MEHAIQIYLASASPRRAELLTQLGVKFEVVPSDIPEHPGSNELARDYVIRLAQQKAMAGWNRLDAGKLRPVLGSDTEVVIDGEILGKPRDEAHAIQMLSRLSGRAHDVFSAVAIYYEGRASYRISQSRVTMRPISPQEMHAYWLTKEPLGKAGAYAIQGLAAIFIEHLAGSYSGVMGLPLFETAQLLNEFNISPLQKSDDK